MKDKLISGFVGVIVGGMLVFVYSSFFAATPNVDQGANTRGPGVGRPGVTRGTGEISDEQIGAAKDRIQERTGSGGVETSSGQSLNRNQESDIETPINPTIQ